jgi:hypothetical protein
MYFPKHQIMETKVLINNAKITRLLLGDGLDCRVDQGHTGIFKSVHLG